MTRLTPTDVTEQLDQSARGPGVYALELREPSDSRGKLIREWDTNFDAPQPKGLFARLAEAARLVYVGSHGRSVYERITQHAAGEKSSTIMDVWEPVDIVGVWPESRPSHSEYNRAVALSDDETVVWTDGRYV